MIRDWFWRSADGICWPDRILVRKRGISVRDIPFPVYSGNAAAAKRLMDFPGVYSKSGVFMVKWRV